MSDRATTAPAKLDPITFEVLRHKLDEIIAEAYYTMGRVSGSPVVYESGDHQETICTASGDAAVFGAGVLHWVQSIGAGVKHVIARYGENPGFEEDDQFLLNDPYVATVHGQDIQVLAPVFFEGEIVAWAGSASHQTDIGGVEPGSLCLSAKEVFQEGFLTPGLKIVERGVVRRDVEDTFANAVRMPELGLLDIRAKIAANNVMKTRLVELFERYGAATVTTLFDQLIDHSEQRVRARLRSVPDGTWTSENWVEGIGEEILKVKVAVTKVGDRVSFDFDGSSPQSASSLNIGPVGTMSSAANPFIAMICQDIPWNAGLFKPLEFHLPERSIVNPARPAAVSASVPTGGNVLVLTTCQNALSQMLLGSETLRGESCGNSAAAHNTIVLAGQAPHGGFFTALILDGAAGGGGGFPDRDGADTAQNQWTVKTMIMNVETVEMLNPVLYLWRAEVPDSGGPGEHRGGVGLDVALIPWGTPAMIAICIGSARSVRNCLGYAGGYPAIHSPVRVLRGADVPAQLAAGTLPSAIGRIEGAVEALPAKAQALVTAGDVLHGYVGSGGGGFGDPLRRAPERVLTDVVAGTVSVDGARESYGVVLAGSPPALDAEATEQERAALRAERRERMAMLPLDGIDPARLREHLAPHGEGDAPGWTCNDCGAPLESLGRYDESISRFEPAAVAAADDAFVLRHTACPSCTLLLDVAMVPAGDA